MESTTSRSIRFDRSGTLRQLMLRFLIVLVVCSVFTGAHRPGGPLPRDLETLPRDLETLPRDLETLPRDLETLYRSGIPFEEFLGRAEQRRERWVSNYAKSKVPAGLLERARRVDGTIYLLAVAVDGCSDSVNTIPYLARLVEQVDGLYMRIVDSEAGASLMQSHRTPDGRAATPTVLILDHAFREIGAFIERPIPLQDWARGEGASLDGEAFLEAKFNWYDEDLGRSTMEEVIARMEYAAVPERMKGHFLDDYGNAYEISPEIWIQQPASLHHVVEWNAEARYLIARNDVENIFDPGAWTRIDWIPLDDMEPWTWAFCMTAWDANSAQDARSAAEPDPANPRTGCGGHPYSRMKRFPQEGR